MENYVKGRNVEPEFTRDSIPTIIGLSSHCLWMKIKAGTKMKGAIEVAERGLRDDGSVLFSGYGAGVTKVITCSEILKRK